MTKLHESPSPILRLVVAAVLLTLAGAGAFAVSSHKTVTLNIDGAQMKVSTMKSRVIDVVEENGYRVGERDDLFPGANQPVTNAETIVLRRSRPLQISLDGRDAKQVWTTASTVDEALAELRMTDTAPAAASRGSRLPLEGMALPVVSAKTVQINDGGVVSTVHLAAPNVAGLLAAAGAPLEQADSVVPAPSSPVIAGMQIQVTRTRIEKVTQQMPLAPVAQRIEDPTLNMSRQVVEDPGTPGVQDVTFAVAKVNGVETGRLPLPTVSLSRRAIRFCGSGRSPAPRCLRSRTVRSGTPFPDVKRAETGPSIPATVTTVVCNLIKTPGKETAVCAMLCVPIWRPGKNKLRLLK